MRKRQAIKMLRVFFRIEREKCRAEFLEAFSNRGRVGKLIEAAAPKIRNPFPSDNGWIRTIDWQKGEADFLRKLLAGGAFLVERGTCGESLALIFLAVGIAAPMRFLFEKQEIAVAHEIGRTQSAHAATHDYDFVSLGDGPFGKLFSIANLVANLKMIAVHVGLRCTILREQR